MDDIELTYERALELVNRAVNEKGADYVYPKRWPEEEVPGNGCFYLHEDGPGCIVGHVLHWVGLTDDELRSIEGMNANLVNKKVPRLLMDEDAATFLGEVQSYQDSGEPWGVAVIDAQRVMWERTND